MLPCRGSLAAVRLVAMLAAAVLAAGCAAGQTAPARPGSSGGLAVGATSFPAGQRPAPPEVSGTSLTGAPLRLRDYRGRVVVLNFWASWCVPCRSEAPVLARLWRGYQSRDTPVRHHPAVVRRSTIVRLLGDDRPRTPALAAVLEAARLPAPRSRWRWPALCCAR